MLDVSLPGLQPLPAAMLVMLGNEFSYQHKKLLRGHDRFGPDGAASNMEIERRFMCRVEAGRLVTGFGFLTRLVQVLNKYGCRVRYMDVTPPVDPKIYTPDWDNVRMRVKFRARQEECLQQLANNQCGIVNATTGFGKTYMFEALCHLYPYAKFDIVVGLKDVANRIVRQLSGSIPNVGQIGGGKKKRGNRVNVYVSKSIHHARHTEANFLLADEAHTLMTPDIIRGIDDAWKFTRNFGFTASPTGRMDGAHAMLEMYFGPEIFTLSYQDAVELGLVVPIRVRWLPIRLDRNPVAGMDGVRRMRWGVWRNEERNRLIAEDVRKNYSDPNTQVLILTATTEHAVSLWQYLKEFSLCYGDIPSDKIIRYKRSGYLPANFIPMSATRREQLRDGFESGAVKRVIATDVWATGVDFANLQVLYRVDARESEILDIQGPGRVSRIAEGKQYGEVIDCYDVFDKNFKRKSDRRKASYKKLGWAQEGVSRGLFDG